jgi:hypothetical protein
MIAGKYRHTPQERAALLRELRWILDANNEQELMRILREQGVKDENPRFAAVVKIFRDLRSGKT